MAVINQSSTLLKKSPFKTILIANRGEIACRVIRTARKLGYRTVAVFSDADDRALHIQLADTAIAIHGNTPKESYLSIEKIIDACGKSGADAVHPGYGFLSENAEFAKTCQENGFIFIGPDADAIEAMGNKSRAKALMIEAGVPCIPGYQGEEQDLEYLVARGKEIGFPLMVKAANGGGGRGLRLANGPAELRQAMESARSEAERAFGSGQLLLERAIVDARHVELQIVGDKLGNVIHLGERDCSIQRRHQKVFEESPSLAVNASLRAEMGAAAVAAARAINYVGAGTIEFLLDQDGKFYFIEMNTRLQVEHPITEMIAGIDLVEWQINIAAGYPLPITQEEVKLSGHAIEARLYAEDPDKDFRPQVGQILHFCPASEDFARTDHGLSESDRVSPYYDSMLAKIISSGPDRESSIRRLERALSDTTILGIKTNREFLLHCLKHRQFFEGRTDTGFIERTWQADAKRPPSPDLIAMAVVILLDDESQSDTELAGWSSNGLMNSLMKLSVDDLVEIDVQIEFLKRYSWRLRFGSETKVISLLSVNSRSGEFLIDDSRQKASFVRNGEEVHISSEEYSHRVSDILFKPRALQDAAFNGSVLSPTDGLIASIEAQVGQYVEKGARLCTVEAMKLMQAVCAPASGYVSAVLSQLGHQVKAKQLIVQIELGERKQDPQAEVDGTISRLVEV